MRRTSGKAADGAGLPDRGRWPKVIVDFFQAIENQESKNREGPAVAIRCDRFFRSSKDIEQAAIVGKPVSVIANGEMVSPVQRARAIVKKGSAQNATAVPQTPMSAWAKTKRSVQQARGGLSGGKLKRSRFSQGRLHKLCGRRRNPRRTSGRRNQIDGSRGKIAPGQQLLRIWEKRHCGMARNLGREGGEGLQQPHRSARTTARPVAAGNFTPRG